MSTGSMHLHRNRSFALIQMKPWVSRSKSKACLSGPGSLVVKGRPSDAGGLGFESCQAGYGSSLGWMSTLQSMVSGLQSTTQGIPSRPKDSYDVRVKTQQQTKQTCCHIAIGKEATAALQITSPIGRPSLIAAPLRCTSLYFFAELVHFCQVSTFRACDLCDVISR